MRFVVTGGAGFIGSHLAEELSKKGEVIIVDNLSTGKMGNIEHLIKRDNVRFVKGSINELDLLQRVFKDIHYVFHIAAVPSVPRSIKDPMSTNEVNVKGTLNVLIASKSNGVMKVVYASSSSVYGDTLILPKREDMKPDPLSPYAVSKLAGEYYCRAFCEAYDLNTISLRFFNVFGPRQDPFSEYAAVIPKFIKSIQDNKRPTIYGDGEQTRDFTFVRDVVKANILAAKSNQTGVFNTASGERVSINKLAEMIMELSGKDLKPVYEGVRKGDVKHSLADISKAKRIGYEPEYDLRRGLGEMIGGLS